MVSGNKGLVTDEKASAHAALKLLTACALNVRSGSSCAKDAVDLGAAGMLATHAAGVLRSAGSEAKLLGALGRTLRHTAQAGGALACSTAPLATVAVSLLTEHSPSMHLSTVSSLAFSVARMQRATSAM